MSAAKTVRLNDQITCPQIRLIDAEGENRGVCSTAEALEMAQESGLDLVEISPNAEPPVARIMDYGKFKFEQAKKAQEAKKKQKQIQIKEVKFRPGTDEGDYKVKLRNLRRFIEGGDKGKVTIRFRGREMRHQELGGELLDKIEQDMSDIAVVEQRPKMEGRQMIMVLTGKKK
ncbi:MULTISPECIES: translation initiation factor IF-3 [unclassified Thioalkalivibrio]|uniref:translation initiation factor IF-3 n=1 Tax=unclassified Thioalkalivibrio TaxID=2621013 RepID=UPI0009DB3E3C|nr:MULTISPECIES: translation initiation factor IF-3 [unclassified Thioalkalivibrio]